MNLSDNLKQLRKDNDLSQEALAEILGVSRQSVSKWESGAAYPEMDKVLQICEHFKISIDELMHEDVKHINENKNAKSNVNKVIDDFLDFITRSVNLFFALKFKDKCKCLVEQSIIIIALIFVFSILYSIIESSLRSIFTPISGRFIFAILGIFQAVFIIAALILSFIIWLNIFKTRYLDYYEVIKVKNDAEEENIEKVYSKNKKVTVEEIPSPIRNMEINREPQIIIRDDSHSSYRFFKAVSKVLLFFAKVIVGFIAIPFMFLLLMWGVMLVLIFMFSTNTLFFAGSFIALLSCAVATFIFLKFMYDFIFNHKTRNGLWGIVLGISIITCGMGLGLFFIDFTKVDIIYDLSSKEMIAEEHHFEMNDNLAIGAYINRANISYVASDNEDVKIIIEHSKYASSRINKTYEEYNDKEIITLDVFTYLKDENVFPMLRKSIADLNNYKIYNYSSSKVTIYTTQENIDILMNNYEIYDRIIHRHTYYYSYDIDEDRGYVIIDYPYEIEEESF